MGCLQGLYGRVPLVLVSLGFFCVAGDGLGFRVQGLGYRVEGLEWVFRVCGSMFRTCGKKERKSDGAGLGFGYLVPGCAGQGG